MTSSLPPHLLRASGSRPGAPRRGAVTSTAAAPRTRVPQRLRVTSGQPGAYDPDLTAGERPRNVTVLADVAEPGTDAWPAGSYVPVGTSGKRAHWTGSEWKGGESPGYSDRSETEQSPQPEPLPDRPIPMTQVDADAEDSGQ